MRGTEVNKIQSFKCSRSGGEGRYGQKYLTSRQRADNEKCTEYNKEIKEKLVLNSKTWKASLKSSPEVLLRLTQQEIREVEL